MSVFFLQYSVFSYSFFKLRNKSHGFFCRVCCIPFRTFMVSDFYGFGLLWFWTFMISDCYDFRLLRFPTFMILDFCDFGPDFRIKIEIVLNQWFSTFWCLHTSKYKILYIKVLVQLKMNRSLTSNEFLISRYLNRFWEIKRER